MVVGMGLIWYGANNGCRYGVINNGCRYGVNMGLICY